MYIKYKKSIFLYINYSIHKSLLNSDSEYVIVYLFETIEI